MPQNTIFMLEGTNLTGEPSRRPNTGEQFDTLATWTYECPEGPVRHVRLSPNEQDVIVSQWDATANIISSRTGRISYSIPFIDKNSLVTSSAYNPYDPRLILLCGSEGNLGIYSLHSENYVWTSNEENNFILTCGFNNNGDYFATAGKDMSVRVYDSQTHEIVHRLDKNNFNTDLYHNNRVLSVVFDPNNSNILFSGGWDNRVIMWDLRVSSGIRNFGGPVICGDSIDVRDGVLLTGSWRKQEPLELWDVGSAEVIKSCEWGLNDKCSVYSAKFAKRGSIIVAGGSDVKSARVFAYPDLKGKEMIGGFNDAVNSVAVSDSGRLVILASQDGHVQGFLR